MNNMCVRSAVPKLWVMVWCRFAGKKFRTSKNITFNIKVVLSSINLQATTNSVKKTILKNVALSVVDAQVIIVTYL